MDSERPKSSEQEFKEPKKKKNVPGVVPRNPFPIIFWKKLGIPPCNDLWPSYNGLFDGEGVIFSSSEDISDIHSMGYFGRNVFEDRGHNSNIRGVPVVRERQWKMMVKWATDFGYVITERDTSEDGRKVNDEESSSKTGSSKGVADSEGYDLDKFNSKSVEDKGGVKSDCDEGMKVFKDSDSSECKQTSGEETKEGSFEGKREDVEVRGEECQDKPKPGEADDVIVKCARKASSVGSGRKEQRGMKNEQEEGTVEVVEEISCDENPKISKTNVEKEEDLIASNGSSNQSKIDFEAEARVVSLQANEGGGAIDPETRPDAGDLISGKEPEKKEKNIEDFIEIIEEKDETPASEFVDKNNGLREKVLKRRLGSESSCRVEKRMRKDASKSGGECEIVEVNGSKSEGGTGEREILETDDDIIVVSVGNGSSNYCSNRSRGRFSSNKSLKDAVPPLGNARETKNDASKNVHKKCKHAKKNEAIEIDLCGKESERDSSKCDDVKELNERGSSLRYCEAIEEQESPASSLKSDCEVSPCIVIPDSDDETERGPQWESDPSLFLPSLEWLKLFPEEAFFLAYGLGCVQVWDGRTDNENESIQGKEKKPFPEDEILVDSEFKKENPAVVASLPCKSKCPDGRSQVVHSVEEMETSETTPRTSNLRDEKASPSDVKVSREKSEGKERKWMTTDAINGNCTLLPEKPRDNRPCSMVGSEDQSDCGDEDGLITVIDLVDSPPSQRQLFDRESSSNDYMDPAVECVDSKQKPEVILNFQQKAMSLQELWNAFRQSRASQSSMPFETSYAVYHHFRSKGWVVKPGIRFGGDFLLYKEGPSFYHASYLVVIDSSLPHEPSSVTWSTLAGFNRLAENVAKELIICRVEWPGSMSESQLRSPKCLNGLTVEEILVKRWVSMKERDSEEMVSDDDKKSDFIPLVF